MYGQVRPEGVAEIVEEHLEKGKVVEIGVDSSMNDLAYIEAEVTFLPKSEGGREKPPPHLSDCGYRPHLVVGDPKQRKAITIANVGQETYFGVAFHSGPENAEPNETFIVELVLVYWPHPDYDSLIPGATFTIREGASIVGYGKVTQVFIPAE